LDESLTQTSQLSDRSQDRSQDNEQKNDPFADEESEKDQAFKAWLQSDDVSNDVCELLRKSENVFTSLSLKENKESYVHVVETLVDITRTQSGKSLIETEPASWAYNVMDILLKPLHGALPYLLAILCRYILPSILMNYNAVVGSVIPKEFNGVRLATLDYVIETTKNEQSTWPVVLYFIQHMCIRVPDRAQYRSTLVLSIRQFINSIPALIPRLTQFIFKLSKNAKASHRLLAVDIAAEVISQTNLLTSPDLKIPISIPSNLSPKVSILNGIPIDEKKDEKKR